MWWLLACSTTGGDTGIDTDFCLTHAWQDLDGDGWGSETEASTSCDVPVGFVTQAGDCDDLAANVNPGAVEVCDDGIDNDCDGRGCPPSGQHTVSDAAWIGHGYAANHFAGTSVAGGRDVDGDGFADLLIGAPQASDGGTAYLMLGPVSGSTDLVDADAKIRAPDGGWGGGATAFVDDFDGDGLPDVVTGAPYTDADFRSSAGALLLTSGAQRNTVVDEESIVLRGVNTTYLGHKVAAAADRNGDGRGDVWASSAPDTVFLVRGGLDGELDELVLGSITHTLGYVTSLVPVPLEADFDGDGLPDLALGFPSTSQVAVYHDVTVGQLTEADADVLYTDHGDLGSSVAAGDLDGDGQTDLVVGAPAARRPSVFVVRGPPTGEGPIADHASAHARGEPGDELGHAVASLPDLDGDGRDELVASAPYRDSVSTNTGEVFLFYAASEGTLELPAADMSVIGANGDLAGYSLAAAGDVNGEGCSALLVGVYAWDAESGSNAGAGALFGCSPF